MKNVILLARATREITDTKSSQFVKPGNFTLVTDKPELRFHDGVAIGGVVINLPEEVYTSILNIYSQIDNQNSTNVESTRKVNTGLFFLILLTVIVTGSIWSYKHFHSL